MSKVKLFKHQQEVLDKTEHLNKVAYYLDMGLGKTFVGSEKAKHLDRDIVLLICQKSKIDDWIEHYQEFYPEYTIYNLRDKKKLKSFMSDDEKRVGVINYELTFRRKELLDLENFTLMLDESSYIKNDKAKRSKFIAKLNYSDVILLSGTPIGGKYEELWSQVRLLGYNISKRRFYKEFIITHKIDVGGFPINIVVGYKNIDVLKERLKKYGAVFMKTEEVIDLPEQIDTNVKCKSIPEYKRFRDEGYTEVGELEFIGGNSLTKMLYERQLCGIYNKNKLDKFKDIIESTNDRVIVFYNFTEEYNELRLIAEKLDKPISVVNGSDRDLKAYNDESNSITFIQYQAGSTGLNLQKANKLIYYSPTLSAEMFMQSKKRIHRIGQNKTCFYYYMITKNSIEVDIYNALSKGEDFTNKLFEKTLDK